MKSPLEIAEMAIKEEAPLDTMRDILDKAMTNGEWDVVKLICNMPDTPQKPSDANKEVLLHRAKVRRDWNTFFQLQHIFKEEDYMLVAGPLPKSMYTVEFEKLARRMMEVDGEKYTIEYVEGDYIFVFDGGERFNWSKISEHANLQHVELKPEDFAAYQYYMSTQGYLPGERCTLDPSQEMVYRKQLYEHAGISPDSLPTNPINFQEMQAINIYTGSSYRYINQLLWGEWRVEDFIYSKANTRAAIIHAALCASGLQKIPQTPITASYRGVYHDLDYQAERIAAAAKHGVVRLLGFVSTSIDEKEAFDGTSMYKFNNLRGMYVAPISQNEHEQEFLIPPTQIQLYSYTTKESKQKIFGQEIIRTVHYFEGSCVSDVGHSLDEEVAAKKPESEVTLDNTQTFREVLSEYQKEESKPTEIPSKSRRS